MYEFRDILELNQRACTVLFADEQLSSLKVKGELSGIKNYSYGSFFNMKDGTSQISCFMYKNRIDLLNFRLEEGLSVNVTGFVSIYPERGSYRLEIDTMSRAGVGDLAEQMRRLYERLRSEGLFAPEHKKKLPLLPRRIGVISSSQGAVIHDIINTLSRRNPHFDLLLYPSAVQGESCAREVCEGLNYFMSSSKVDVIIIARGGGSIEDLWGFNDETLARTIYNCSIPVISAVGHETDYTICDYVSDMRTPTPTAAAELVMPSYEELKGRNRNLRDVLDFSIKSIIDRKRNQLKYLSENKALYTPMYNIEIQKNRLNLLKERFNSITDKRLTDEKNRIGSLRKSLALLGPSNTLDRGYSYIISDGRTVRNVSQVRVGDEIRIFVSDGVIEARVENIKENE
ncbi:MAG: exodeoxyribonuclease VII large subunit [Clostridiales bacterium]|nr:exodeoxyribonuclease VII large subunit [Clostridiales bacterium]